MAEEQEEQQPEIIVRPLDERQESKVEQEKRFLQEEEEKQQVADETEDKPVSEVVERPDLTEDDVLSFIKKTKNKDVTSIDDLFKEPEVVEREQEIPFEDVKAFLEYRKKTGRGLDDFIKLNRDLEKEDPNQLLADYYRTVEDFDNDDIKAMMKKFSYDEDMHTDDEIEERKLAFKREVKKARKHFEGLKEQFNVPLESRDTFVPEEEREAYKSFKTRTAAEEKTQGEAAERSRVFAEKTNALLSDKFEGFDFNLGESSIKFKPAEAETLKKSSNIQNFISKFLDENGFLSGDGSEFHKSIAMASNPDQAAKFFYEKGVADAIERMEKEGKNIDFRGTPPAVSNDGIQVRVLDSNGPTGMKYRKR